MPKPIDAVVADLTRETSWSSLSVDVALEQVRLAEVGDAKPGTTTGNREEYRATAAGRRRYAQFARVEGREVCTLLGYSDGERCASVLFRPVPDEGRQRAVTISRSFLREEKTGTAEVPAMLPYFVGLEPLRGAIRRAEAVGPSRVLDRACERYYFAGVRAGDAAQEMVFHLDAATSCPLKVESFVDRAGFAAGRPFAAWEAVKLDEIQGHHVAVDSRLSTFGAGRGGRWGPVVVDSYHVTTLRFDAEPPAAEFWPRFEPGIAVYDRIAGRVYKAGADGQPVAAPPAAAPGGPSTLAGATTLALALMLLIVGIARRRRGRGVPG